MTQDAIGEFIDFMRSNSIGPHDASEIIADDEIHRYRLGDDKERVKTGSYRLAVDDSGFAFGWCQSFKEGITYSWHTKSKRKWSAEDKAAHKAKVTRAKQDAEERRKKAAEKSRQEALDLWSRSSKLGSSPYCDSKGINPRGVRYDGDTLIVPMWRDGEIANVQRILADGTKLFSKGSDHVGSYWSVKGDLDTIAICEGVATGCKINEATGWSVICAFNAGNLKPVAQAIRKKYPDARIIIAADNDHTATKSNGDPWNPGIEKAQQAAVAIGGAQVISPDTEDGVSDWDDVARLHGIDAVRYGLNRAPVVETQPEPEDTWEPDYTPDDVVDDDPMSEINPLGYDRERYFFLPRIKGQLQSFKATDLERKGNLFQLAPHGFWLRNYAPEESMSKIAEYAAGQLTELCHRKGVFSPENVRGVGAWSDSGKYLVNCGDVIVGEGIRCRPSDYQARYVYEAGPRVIDLSAEPMSNKEGAEFRDLCKMLSWRRPQFADLMAGWIVVAMVGSALKWRPHIVITGSKGSGKSTVMDKIVKAALGDIAVKRDGGTTEPGVRQALGRSGRPFVMDEAESESKQMRSEMEKIFFLFRRASSGSEVQNAYETYVIRSCACFAAINPRIEQGADKDRNTVLELVADQSDDMDEKYARIVERIKEVMTSDFSSRLMSRTVAHLDILIDNIEVFGAEASKVLGSMRAGDQVGPLIAGAYSLISTKRVTPEFAAEWMAEQDWQWHIDNQDGTDSEKLVSKIMTSRVRYDVDGMSRESDIGSMVWMAAHVDSVGHDAAVRGLKTKGMKIEGDRLVISNNCGPIKDLLRDTPWSDYRRVLGGYPGADNADNRSIYFSPGINTKATGIPLADVLGREDVAVDEGGWQMEGFE